MEGEVSPSTDPWVAQMEGDAALPRSNGELVFDAPWQGRAFGLAVSLVEQAGYDWEDFRRLLIAHIAENENESAEPAYYERCLAALEELVISKHLATKDEVDRRMEKLAQNQREEWVW